MCSFPYKERATPLPGKAGKDVDVVTDQLFGGTNARVGGAKRAAVLAAVALFAAVAVLMAVAPGVARAALERRSPRLRCRAPSHDSDVQSGRPLPVRSEAHLPQWIHAFAGMTVPMGGSLPSGLYVAKVIVRLRYDSSQHVE
jgi:hypothetical protein